MIDARLRKSIEDLNDKIVEERKKPDSDNMKILRMLEQRSIFGGTNPYASRQYNQPW